MTFIQHALRLSVPVTISRMTLTTAGLLVLAIALPIGFHQFGLGGRVWLPMHIPALLAGFLAGPLSGIIVGALAPTLSHAMTGMPPEYAVPLMSVELACYGLVAGICYYQLKWNIFATLLLAWIAGRVMFGATLATLSLFIEMPYTASSWFTSTSSAMLLGWPGLLVQLVVVPLVVWGMGRILKTVQDAES